MEIVVWGTYTNSSHIVLRGHQRHVFYLRFSHNGKMLVSIDYDYKVKIWNIQDGNPIHAIEEDSMNFKNAKLCTSNKILYASSEDVILILEHKPLQELITELRDKYYMENSCKQQSYLPVLSDGRLSLRTGRYYTID